LRPSAIVLLAWGLLKALARRAVRPRGGFDRVLRHYEADRIRPLLADERPAVLGASACIACGRCDEIPADRSPSDWILAGLRDLTDRDVADPPSASDSVLEEMARACPAAVPFRDLASAR